MSLKDRIAADLTAAMKSKDAARLGVLRMLKAKIMEAEVEQRAAKGPAHQIEDAHALAAIAAYAKQRRDSIDAYRRGGREDLAAKEQAELALVQEYLPAQLTGDEIRRIVDEAVAESGATSMKDLGKVMKLVVPRTKGSADGETVSRVVREVLGGGS